MKTFFRITLQSLLLLFLYSTVDAQPFMKLYGEGHDHGGAQVKIVDGFIYRTGNIQRLPADPIATFSKYDLNGNLQWMVELDRASTFADFVATEDNAFLVVGTTLPFNSSTNSQSILSKIDVNGNVLHTQYFETTGREYFTHIVRRNNDNGAFPYYILSWLNKNVSPGTSDDAAVFNVNEDGNVNWQFRYRTTNNDDLQISKVLMPWITNGRLSFMGSYTPWNGHITTIQGNGNVWASHDLGSDLDILDARQDPSGDIFIVGSTSTVTTGFIARIRLTANGGSVVWAVEIPAFTNISRITSPDSNGRFYVAGYGNMFTGVDKSAVIQLQDNGANIPTINWVRHLEDGETFFGGATVAVTDNDQLLYHDVRTNNPNGTSARDFLMGIFDDQLTSCITVEEEVELIPFEFPITLNEVEQSDLSYEVERTEEFATVDLETFPLCCGSLVEDTLTFSCTPQNAYDFSFSLQNFTSYNVTSVFIPSVPGYTFSDQYWTQGTSTNLPIAANGGIAGLFNMTIIPNVPITTDTVLCLDIIYLSDDYECCHFEYCITLEPIDPCAHISLVSTKLDTDEGCCYDIEVINDYCDDYFVGIQTEILTPGISFASYAGGSNWTASANTTNTTVDWTPNGRTYITTGSTLDMTFCLEGIVSYSQVPQEIVFHWLTLDATGQATIACSDTLEFECEPCVLVTEEVITCDTAGNYSFSFVVTNNTNPAHTSTNILLEVYNPGVSFSPSFFGVTLNSGDTYAATVDILGPVSAGDVLLYKVLLVDEEGWCCHLDSLEVIIPECEMTCDCGDVEKYLDDVNAGFDLDLNCSDEMATFTPLRTNACDIIVWSFDNLATQPILSGDIPGDMPAVFAFPTQATYEVCMRVFRYDENGELCFGDLVETYCETVDLLCPDTEDILVNADNDFSTDDGVNVYWQLPPHQIFEAITVKRQVASGHWRTVALLEGSATHFRDLAPAKGQIAYKIEGKMTKGYMDSNIAAVFTGDSADLTAHLYPNPATEKVRVELSKAGQYQLAVYNANGQLVQNQQYDFLEDIPQDIMIENLQVGVYILRVNGVDGYRVQKRFVKLASW